MNDLCIKLFRALGVHSSVSSSDSKSESSISAWVFSLLSNGLVCVLEHTRANFYANVDIVPQCLENDLD